MLVYVKEQGAQVLNHNSSANIYINEQGAQPLSTI